MSIVTTIGYVTKAKEDWADYAAPVFAPSNYKDPAKIESYIAQARTKQEIEAGESLLTSVLAGAAVCVDQNGQVGDTFTYSSEEPLVFLDRLFDALTIPEGRVFCQRPSLFFHVVCSMALSNDYLAGSGLGKFLLSENTKHVHDPFGLIGGSEGAKDPVRVLHRYKLLRQRTIAEVAAEPQVEGRTHAQQAKDRLESVNKLCKALGFKD